MIQLKLSCTTFTVPTPVPNFELLSLPSLVKLATSVIFIAFLQGNHPLLASPSLMSMEGDSHRFSLSDQFFEGLL